MDDLDFKKALKPFDWKTVRQGDWHTAYTPFGSYHVEKYKDETQWKWGYCFDEYYDEEEYECDSAEDGKQKCWEHWVGRMKPMLKSPVMKEVEDDKH
jgi:hypothetical protein